jgi:hypothetical protein
MSGRETTRNAVPFLSDRAMRCRASCTQLFMRDSRSFCLDNDANSKFSN